jgi:hypothetical protein
MPGEKRQWPTKKCQPCLESEEPTSAGIESIAGREEVPTGHSENCQSTEGAVCGLASSHRMLPIAKEMDPGCLWVPGEIGSRPQRDDPPCHSCTVQGTRLSGTRLRQFCKRNLRSTDVPEEMLGATAMRQRHKEPRPKRAIMSEKQKNTQ